MNIQVNAASRLQAAKASKPAELSGLESLFGCTPFKPQFESDDWAGRIKITKGEGDDKLKELKVTMSKLGKVKWQAAARQLSTVLKSGATLIVYNEIPNVIGIVYSPK